MVCPNCGSENDNSNSMCSNCGCSLLSDVNEYNSSTNPYYNNHMYSSNEMQNASQRKKSPLATVVNVFLYIFALMLGIIIVIACIGKSVLSKNTVKAVVSQIDTYEVIDSVTNGTINRLNIEENDFDTFFEKYEADDLIVSSVDQYIDGMFDGNIEDALKNIQGDVVTFIDEHRDEISKDLGVQITDKDINNIENSIDELVDDFTDELEISSDVEKISENKAAKLSRYMISMKGIVILFIVFLIFVGLIFVVNRKLPSFLFQVGSMFFIFTGIFALILKIISILKSSIDRREDMATVSAAVLDSIHSTLTTYCIVTLIIAVAAIIGGIIINILHRKKNVAQPSI